MHARLSDGKPLFALPSEPAGHYELAEHCGELVAAGVLSDDVALGFLHILAHRSPSLDAFAPSGTYPRGFVHRLIRHKREVFEATERRLDRADFFIRRAVRPLLAAGEPDVVVERAAERANRGELARAPMFTILREEFLAARYRQPRRRSRRR